MCAYHEMLVGELSSAHGMLKSNTKSYLKNFKCGKFVFIRVLSVSFLISLISITIFHHNLHWVLVFLHRHLASCSHLVLPHMRWKSGPFINNLSFTTPFQIPSDSVFSYLQIHAWVEKQHLRDIQLTILPSWSVSIDKLKQIWSRWDVPFRHFSNTAWFFGDFIYNKLNVRGRSYLIIQEESRAHSE